MEKLNVPIAIMVTFLFVFLLSGCQAGLKTGLITSSLRPLPSILKAPKHSQSFLCR
ncbi:MAG: hypothetical protein AB1611_06450 [bacterium]